MEHETNKLKTVKEVSKKPVEQHICTGDVDEDYEQKSCAGKWQDTIDKSKKVSQFVCKSSGDIFTCETEQIIFSDAIRTRQEMYAESGYITPTQFQTIYTSGAIVWAEEGTEIDNASELENALPVEYAVEMNNLINLELEGAIG